MKLRKLARQLTAAAVAGCMALSLCVPALAETWDLADTSKYEYGSYAKVEVRRFTDKQSLDFYQAAPDTIYKYDEDPVFAGNFKVLCLYGLYGPTANAAVQGVYLENSDNMSAAIDAAGSAELTLSGSNTAAHALSEMPAIDIDDSGALYNTPGLLTIKGSGSLTATAPSIGVRLRDNSTLNVAGGTVNVTATGTDSTGINADGGKVLVSGGKLDVTGEKYGINVAGGTVQVDSGTLDASGGSYGIVADQLETTGGTLNASASADGRAAVTSFGTTVNGGVLNVENTASSCGLIVSSLKVQNGTLNAKGKLVVGNPLIEISGGVVNAGTLSNSRDTYISGGWVNVDTLDTANGKIIFSGGNIKVKNMPSFRIFTFSGSARLTIEDPVTESEISALAAAFQNGETTRSAYLKYKPADISALPADAELVDGYVVLRGKDTPDDPNGTVYDDITEIGSAPSGDAGGVLAAVAIGGAALWGGYEVATRVILHKLLPEGAAIPKNQAELALLLWNTAGQPEPASAPAFANVDDTTAKAAQWCTEQGYLSGEFKPEKRVAKYNVIRTWSKAFPQVK